MNDRSTSTGRLAVRGVALNWIGRGCRIVITFLLTPIMLAGLGVEAFGLWAIVASLGTYYLMADLGFGAAGVKYISSALAKHDHENAQEVIQVLIKAHAIAAIVILAVSFGVAGIVANGIETITVSKSEIYWTTCVMGMSVAVGVAGLTFESTIIAMKRFDQLNVVAVFCHVIEAGIMFFAIRNGEGVFTLAWIVLSVMLVRVGIVFILAQKALPFPILWHWNWSRATMKKLASFGLLNVFVGGARRVANYSGAIIVGFVAGPVAAGLYAIPQGIASKIEDVSKGVNSVLMPVVSQLEAERRLQDLVVAYSCCASCLFALGLTFVATLFAVGDELIAFWIGQEYVQDCYPILVVLSCGMAIRLPSTCIVGVLKGMGCMKHLSGAAVIEAVMTIGITVVLVWRLGIMGMAWGILIVQCIFGMTMLPWILCRELKTSRRHVFVAVLGPGTVAAAPAVAIGVIASRIVSPESYVQIAIWAGLIHLTASVSIYLICLEGQVKAKVHEELRAAMKRIVGMLRFAE